MKLVRVLALVALCVPASAQATILANWSLDQVASHSEAVIIGAVVARRVVSTETGTLWTETEIRVERQLKGSARATWVVSQLGGTGEGRSHGIAGDVHLRVGDQVVLMLERVRGGRWMIVGLSLGAFRLRDGWAVQRVDVPLAEPGGVLLPPPGERVLALEEIEAAVRRSMR